MLQTNETPTRVCVIGLGYVGLPLAMALVRAGHDVLGFDTDPRRIGELRDGNDRTGEVDMESGDAAALALTGEESRLADRDVYIVTVPTPVDGENRPDLEAVLAASASVGRALARSKPRTARSIVVFESTVYPGVTEDICGPTIEAASGKRRGTDFLLGYSPERINPGDRTHGLAQIVKVVAGENEDATHRLEQLYGSVTQAGVYVARNIRTAEAAKVIENAQRDVNIAFVNEIAMIFAKLGLSVDDVLEAARTKWNFLDFRPGLVGGHCIGVDPYYLAHCAAQLGHEAEIILAGRRINDDMGAWIADRIADAYESDSAGACDPAGRSETVAAVRPPRTLVLGLAFKENVPDIRNTRVELLVTRLATRGHQVEVHDALADAAEAKTFYGIDLYNALDAAGDARGAAGSGEPFDCLVAAVAHNEYRAFADEDFVRLVRPGGLIADVKGIWRDRALPANVRRWQL